MAGFRESGVTQFGPRRVALAFLACVAVASCDDLPLLGDDGAPAPASGSGTTPPPEGVTDLEAPEVFQVTEQGLWDGRPSLGGVWVAHPDVGEPERVRIVNIDNGQEVVGALFRRERDLPGPPLQVSSDAAEALGLLAGAPTELRVTALRREAAPEPEPQPAPAEEAPADPAPAEVPDSGADIAAASAILSGSAPADPAPPASAPGSDGAQAVAQATAAILAGGSGAPATIATTSLDGAAPAGASSLTYPFVQLATSSTQDGAEDAARRLAAAGLPALVVPEGSVFRLVLGPVATEAEQEALLARAVAEGYADAYLVRR